MPHLFSDRFEPVIVLDSRPEPFRAPIELFSSLAAF
jgi:hypothetical protein